MSEQQSDASTAAAAADEINITVKSSADQKYSVSVSPSLLVSDFKQLLEPKSDIPTDRQRLIYSGRVLKDHETLASYKIQSGHTIHLVKSAAPPSASGAGAGGASGGAHSTPAATPQNIASGQGANNPLAGLTGARYAGLAQLPSANLFGPDGGMGAPPNEDQLLQAMSNPMFQQSVSQMLQNPQMLDYIINSSPGLQGMGPQVRQMMQSDQFRQMMTNPELMRQMMAMNRMFGGNPLGGVGGQGGGQQAFPEPGRTTSTESSNNTGTNNTTAALSAGDAAQANPFASLFPGGQQPSNGGAANPFSALLNPAFFGGSALPGQNNTSATGGDANNNNPTPAGAFPPFDPQLFNSLFAGGGLGGAPPAQADDNRPPEERYEAQLRQLNELGFFDFDRNVRALRRSGGNVQGAVEALLDGAV
ncbi:hypothetical protein V1514DRAFT_334554 [Lipomyces japonicus]|uniref:uncharacterized protein n=1 Tax=Lipomyces japonicus TaxID=56871 RepID=UPI0034CF2B97